MLIVERTHEAVKEKLLSEGIQYDEFYRMGDADIYEIIERYTGVVIRSCLLKKELISKASNLRFIARLGSGMDNIDADYAAKKGIICFNSAEGSKDAVGEHTLGLLLALFHNVVKSDKEVRKSVWNREGNRGLEVNGKTIGIIGYGNMGSAFAQKISGLGAHVIAYDKYKQNFSDQYVVEVGLDELFKHTDVCSLHVPLTEETIYMSDQRFFRSFKKDFYLINTSRGKVVKTADLVRALKTGKVKGVALDVIEYEGSAFNELQTDSLKEDFNYLVQADNVILTSHIAGYTDEAKRKLAEVLAGKITDFLKKC